MERNDQRSRKCLGDLVGEGQREVGLGGIKVIELTALHHQQANRSVTDDQRHTHPRLNDVGQRGFHHLGMASAEFLSNVRVSMHIRNNLRTHVHNDRLHKLAINQQAIPLTIAV